MLKLPGAARCRSASWWAGNWPLCVARAAASDLLIETPVPQPQGRGGLDDPLRVASLGVPQLADPARRIRWTRCAGRVTAWFVHLLEPVPSTVQTEGPAGAVELGRGVEMKKWLKFKVPKMPKVNAVLEISGSYINSSGRIGLRSDLSFQFPCILGILVNS